MARLARALTAWLLAAMFLCAGAPALAEGTQSVFVPPTLPSDAEPYDADHPENLLPDQLYAQAAILIEANSGKAIFEKNADAVMYPASTTKIMTVLLGLMLGDLNATVTTSAAALAINDTDYSTIPLAEGEEINFRDLLYATMVKSGNEGANVIAESVSGSIEEFVALMNSAAEAFGCTSTHFANAHGLHDDAHYTTARDMARIARVAMQDATFRQIAATTEYTLPKSNIYRSRKLTSGNDFLTYKENSSRYYAAGTGIKTGYTSRAGYCYVGSATKNGISLISVVFYTTDRGRWSDTRKLMEYGFSQYVSVTPEELYNLSPRTIDISGFALDDADLGKLELAIQKVDPASNDVMVLTHDEKEAILQNFTDYMALDFTREFSAPVTAGEVMGTMTYYPPGGEPVEYSLIATRSIARRENLAPTLAQIIAYTEADENPFPRFSADLLLLLLAPLLALYLVIRLLLALRRRLTGRKKQRHGAAPRPATRYYR